MEPPPLVEADPEPEGAPQALSPPAAVRPRWPPPKKLHEDDSDAEEWTAPRPRNRNLPRGWLRLPKAVDQAMPPPLPVPGAGPLARIGLVELFAGLRTGRLAAESQGVEVPLSVVAECCPFANSSPARRGSAEELYWDVCELGEG